MGTVITLAILGSAPELIKYLRVKVPISQNITKFTRYLILEPAYVFLLLNDQW